LNKHKKYKRIVIIGASAGGINAVMQILSKLPSDFGAPIVIAQHMNAFMNMFFIDYLNSNTSLKVREVKHMELLLPGRVYYIPPNYHGLLEEGRLLLNSDAKVNFSRPSIDVFFESVAFEEKENIISVLLSGANNDGTYGMKLVQQLGGDTIVQNPETAEHSEMPKFAISANQPNYILDIEEIGPALSNLVEPIKDE